MKKNKYRWREMKDEKPDVGEFIFIVSKEEIRTPNLLYRLPRVFCYDGRNRDTIIMRTVEDVFSGAKGLPLIEDIILWRKMCKLPDET